MGRVPIEILCDRLLCAVLFQHVCCDIRPAGSMIAKYLLMLIVVIVSYLMNKNKEVRTEPNPNYTILSERKHYSPFPVFVVYKPEACWPI